MQTVAATTTATLIAGAAAWALQAAQPAAQVLQDAETAAPWASLGGLGLLTWLFIQNRRDSNDRVDRISADFDGYRVRTDAEIERQRTDIERHARDLADCHTDKTRLAIEREIFMARIDGLERLVNANHINTSPITEVHANETGIITAASDSITRLLGYRAEAVIGQHVSCLLPPDQRARHDATYAAAVAAGEVRDEAVTGWAQHVDGTLILVIVHISPHRGGGYRGVIAPVEQILPHPALGP